MISSFTIGINLVTRSNNFPLVASNIARQARAAQSSVAGLNRELNGVGNGASSASSRWSSAFSTIGRVGEAAFKAIGLASAAVTASGIKNANDYTVALQRLAVQTGQTVDSVNGRFGPLALAASNRTGMPITDVLGVASQAAGVVKNPKELSAALAGTKTAAGLLDFVNVLQRSTDSPADANEIARNVITADHILNAYTQSDMARVNESLYRSVVGSHMDLGALVTQLGYFGEQFRLASGGRQTATDDILKLGELGYWGVGHGKWGSGFGQILRTLLKPSDKNIPALEALGMLGPDGSISSTSENSAGQFTPLAMIAAAIARTQGMSPMEVQQLVMQALPANAARVMAEALSPKTQAFLQRIDASQADMPTILAAQVMLMDNLGAQTQRLSHNFANLSGILEKPVMKSLADAAGKAADALYNLLNAAKQHPAASAAVGWGVAGAGAIAAWQFLSGARLAFHAFTSGLGTSAIEGGKQFERSMLKAITGAIANLGPRVVKAFSEKFALPLLSAVNKLGPIGQNISSFVLGIVEKMGMFGDGLSALLGILGKIGGPIATIMSFVLTPTPAGDEGDPLSAKRMQTFKKRNQVYRSIHPTHLLPLAGKHTLLVHPVSHREKMHRVVIQNQFTYVAPANEDNATHRRRAAEHHRKMSHHVAHVMSAALKTGAKAAGSTIASAGMSQFEVDGAFA